MLSIEQARAALIDAVTSKTETETIPLESAFGRTLAENIVSIHNVPPADNSAMDGYAIYTESTIPAGTQLKVSQIVAAGVAPQPLASNTAARIFTGAELPANANTVVIQENTSSTEDLIKLLYDTPTRSNVRPAGQDIEQGETIACKGDRLGAAHLGVLASVGITKVKVIPRIKVALLNTGKELIEPGQPLAKGQIYNSNHFTLKALLTQLGCDVIAAKTLPDELQATQDALLLFGDSCDLIVTSGGVSAGDEDYVKNAINNLGSIELWKIQLKPGKPLAFGHINNSDTKLKTPVLGLPGNPVSAYVTLLLFGIPLIRKLQGSNHIAQPQAWPTPTNFAITKRRSRPEFLRVKRTPSGLSLYQNQSSGVLRSLQWADGLALLPENMTINKGDTLEFFSFNELIG